MGLFKKIGKALKPLAKATGLDFIQKTVERGLSFVNKLAEPITKPLSKLVERLPLPRVVKDFAQDILSNPAALLVSAALGPVGTFLKAAGPSQLSSVARILGQTVAAQNPVGLKNLAVMFAEEQAERFVQNQIRSIADEVAA